MMANRQWRHRVRQTWGARPGVWSACIALAACAGAAAGGGSPPMELVNEYTQFVTLPDIDGDGVVSDMDFIAWFVSYVDDVPIVDVNGDGFIDCDDAVLTLAAVLNGLAGDLEPDGVINAQDVAAVVQKMKEPLPSGGITAREGDVNVDGVVDEHDISLILDSIGQSMELSSEDVAFSILESVPGSMCYAKKHSAYFSSTWPGDRRPRWAPPDHHYDFSRTWPPERRPETPPPGWEPPWPANHHADLSRSWPLVDWPYGHMLLASLMNWPGEHGTNFSSKWPPNHNYSVTREWVVPLPNTTWPPHSIDSSSRNWPPNHRLEQSNSTGPHHVATSWRLRPPSPHLQDVSKTRHPAHDPTRSAMWPPNHYTHVTNGWPDSHSMSTSVYWPPNHYTVPSSGWPQDTDPPWLPNHFLETSLKEMKPGVPTSFFPPGHSYRTTFQEVIPLLP